ncbi:unnamed protein product, partial [Mesorhabditis spiculigera]
MAEPGQQQDPVTRAVEASQRGDVEALEECLRQGVPASAKDVDGCSLLHWAAINNSVQCVEKLLASGEDPNVLGGILVSTPLHWAVRVGQLGASIRLVNAGAICNIRDSQGLTPLHLAVQNTHIGLTAYLLAKYPDSRDFTDNAGMTSLMWAAYRCYQMFPLKILIDSGADLNAQETLQGNTALHFAAQERNITAIRELLAAGADPTIPNKQHETPLDIVSNNRHQKIQRMLKKALRRKGALRGTFLDSIKDNPKNVRRIHFGAPFVCFALATIFFQLLHFGVAIACTLLLFGLAMYAIRDVSWQNSYLAVGITVTEPLVMLHVWSFYIYPFVPWYLQILFLVSITAVFGTLGLISLGDPGVIKPNLDKKAKMNLLVEEIEKNTINYFCYSCYVNRPNWSKHCAICDRCVKDFDHHCPWLAQCITMKNMKLFILFVFSVCVSSLIYTIGCFRFLTTELRDISFELMLQRHCWVLLTAMLAGCHVFFMTTLFTVQCINYLEGETTNSRIKRKRGQRGEHGHNHSHGGGHSHKHGQICKRFCSRAATQTDEPTVPAVIITAPATIEATSLQI